VITYKTITIEEAEDKFGLGVQLIDNFEDVKGYNDEYIWTYGDGDDGTYICSGYHVVNRIGYYISEKPVPSGEYYQIDVSRDVECEQCNSANAETEEEVDNDCGNCLGSGYRTEWY
jgi:DnaJ-class molecular chaperone